MKYIIWVKIYLWTSIEKKKGSKRLPRMSIDKVAQDWMDAGVMAYDTPMSTNNMAYHVMVPTKELKAFCSREFRAPGDHFDGGYKNFIKHGPQVPVYVAIGTKRRGRCIRRRIGKR